MRPLHRLVFPDAGRGDAALYLRPLGDPVPSLEGQLSKGKALRLEAGQGVASDTYFGLFPWRQWRRLTGIGDLRLRLGGTGPCRYALKSLEDGSETGAATDPTLAAGTLTLEGEALIDLTAAVRQIEVPGLYLEIRAEGALLLNDVAFLTGQAPARAVALGLIITTFGREEAVGRTAAALASFIAADPEPELGLLSLTIIDNGRTLDPASFPGVTLLPNANLGGAGGFARGLHHLTQVRGTSHACFMDDDAASEGECLLRTRRLLAFARDDRLAVSAAMLRAETSFMMHEQGALFEWGRNHRIISRKNGLDLRRRADLARVLQPEPFRYGGWWFLAFPIGGPLRYPYPLFVRGDDWLFSYLNDFHLETMIGIASWQEGFETKIGPVEQYLTMKAFLVAELMLRDPARPVSSARFFARWIVRNIFGYCYDRAELNLQAVGDVLRGPEFWGRNAALGPRLAELRTLIRQERIGPVEVDRTTPRRRVTGPERKWLGVLRVLSLGGHLVPGFVCRRLAPSAAIIDRVSAPQPRLVFRHPRALYLDDAGQGFVAPRDTARCLRLLIRMAWLLTRLTLCYPRLARAYRASADVYCTREWWDRVFKADAER